MFYGIVYDSPAYNMVLMGLMRSKNYERAEAMVERMEESGVKANFMTYSYLMKGLLDTKMYDKVVNMFDSALDVDAEVVRNVRLYMRMRNFEKATGYIWKMKEEGITPNSRATIIVVKAYVQLGRWDDALEVLKGGKAGGKYFTRGTRSWRGTSRSSRDLLGRESWTGQGRDLAPC